MDTPTESTSQKLRILGWKLLFFQNLARIFLFGLFIPYIFFLLDTLTFIITLSLINLFLHIFLIFDFCSILLICVSPFIYLDHQENHYKKSIIPKLSLILGVLWLSWRFLFIFIFNFFSERLIGNFSILSEFGFIYFNGVAYFRPLEKIDIILNPLIYFDPFSFILLIFFFLQDNHFSVMKKKENTKISLTINIGTIYGLTITVSDLIILPIFFSHLPQYPSYLDYFSFVPLFVILIILKLILIPLIGMQTARKYVASALTKKPADSQSLSRMALVKSWFSDIFTIEKPQKMWPSIIVMRNGFIFGILLLLIPFSPFFLMKTVELDSTPVIDGPHISRKVSDQNLVVLQDIEDLSKEEIENIDPEYTQIDYPICNDTLELFLERIPTKEFLENLPNTRLAYEPRDIFFNWSVTLIENNTQFIKPVEIYKYWTKVSESYYPRLFRCWINDTIIRGDFRSINDSSYANDFLEISWIFYGLFIFHTSWGKQYYSNIEVVQLILFDYDLNIICLVYDQL